MVGHDAVERRFLKRVASQAYTLGGIVVYGDGDIALVSDYILAPNDDVALRAASLYWEERARHHTPSHVCTPNYWIASPAGTVIYLSQSTTN